MGTVNAIFDWAIFIVPHFWEDSIVPFVLLKLLLTGDFSFALSCEKSIVQRVPLMLFLTELFSVFPFPGKIALYPVYL